MSYLFSPRLSFIGRFLSDVSTRNNVTGNYAPDAAQQDLWNPVGGAAVELLDCRMVSGHGLGTEDPATDLVLTGAIDRPSAKMVDLDPEWQFASEIWGLTLRLADPLTGALGMEGRFAVAAFRDLWRRQTANLDNGQPSGARFVSVLTDVTWGPAADASPALARLRETTQDGRLSVCLDQFGYSYDTASPRHRTGSLIVHIGPAVAGEPETALVHRRLQGVTVQGPGGTPLPLLSAIDFAVSADGTRATFELGRALPISDVDGTLTPLPTLVQGLEGVSIALLPGPLSPGTPVDPADLAALIEIPDDPQWYRRTGGVAEVAVPEALAGRITSEPLALAARLAGGQSLVIAQETAGGLFFRADRFVHRMEAGERATIRIHARRFDRPEAGLTLNLRQVLPQGTAPGLATPATVVTDAKGVAEVTLEASDPQGPRAAQALDGQVFAIAYAATLTGAGAPDLAGTGLGQLDVIVVHVRDPVEVPETPEFHRDIQPVMAQYAQLYPIMSRHLFDLADYDALVRNRQALRLAFGRAIEDPNYMPVTRDLSAGRMATLRRWLERETGDLDAPLHRDPANARGGMAAAAAATPVGEAAPDAKAAMAALQAVAPPAVVLRLGTGEA